MTIYIFTIITLFAFAYIEINHSVSSKTKRMMYIIAYILLVFQIGLRWETGTDWFHYLDHFESINDIVSISPFESGFEFGYNLSIWLVKLLSSEYTIFLLFHAIVFYIILFYSFRRITPYFFIALLLFYTATMGFMGCNRQLIALVICLCSLRYVLDKDPIKFFSLVFIAFNFHASACLFIIYYFINRDIKSYALILILAGSIIIGNTSLPVTAFSLIGNLFGVNVEEKVVFYLESASDVLAESGLSLLGLFKRLLFLFIFYYNRKRISEILPYYNLMLNGYIAGLAFYFIFYNSLLIMVSRAGLYFNIMEPLLLSSQICLYKRKENRIVIACLLLLLSFLLFFQSISPYPDLFLPYKGIFINSDYLRIMY